MANLAEVASERRRTAGTASTKTRSGSAGRKPPPRRRATASSGQGRAAASQRRTRGASLSQRSARRAPSAGRRRLGPRRGPSRIRWDRLGRIALTLTLALICFSYFNPALNLFHAYQAKNESSQNLRSLAEENSTLQERAESLENPSILTREARRQGLAVPGERPYVVRNLGG